MIHLGKTAGLTEASDQLTKRYAAQAQNGSRDLILTLLDLANQCDIHYRFAQNKRLHVEIELMKMAYSPYAISMDQPITEKSRSAGENDKKKALREEANSYVEKKSKSDTATSPQRPKNKTPTLSSSEASAPKKPAKDISTDPPTEKKSASVSARSESTRLNSSHVAISYAVFCLKKKTKKSIRKIDTNEVLNG